MFDYTLPCIIQCHVCRQVTPLPSSGTLMVLMWPQLLLLPDSEREMGKDSSILLVHDFID